MFTFYLDFDFIKIFQAFALQKPGFLSFYKVKT